MVAVHIEGLKYSIFPYAYLKHFFRVNVPLNLALLVYDNIFSPAEHYGFFCMNKSLHNDRS
jgi:hypothetical protein